jgi:hypothetical protein
MVKFCVPFATQNEFLNTIQVSLSFKEFEGLRTLFKLPKMKYLLGEVNKSDL